MGICINPTPRYFYEFCQKGFSLQEIDCIIATKPSEHTQEAIATLLQLNREANKTLLSYGQKPHIIRFFLHPELYTKTATLFRALFREEVGSFVSLETFAKGEEVRPLSDSLTLSYIKTVNDSLSIRLDGKSSYGILSESGFSESLVDFFMPCSLLILEVGDSSPEDLEKVTFQPHALGYFGLYKLLRLLPDLKTCLISGFSRSMGDCRLELCQKLALEAANCVQLLPLDTSLLHSRHAVCADRVKAVLSNKRCECSAPLWSIWSTFVCCKRKCTVVLESMMQLDSQFYPQ